MSDFESPIARWLHLTDLHIGTTNESQAIAVNALVSAVEERATDVPFDFMLLTGDVAYSGQQEQYSRFRSEIIEPLRSLSSFRNAQVLATPGNHDMNCDIDIPPSWKDLGRTRQERFFNLGPDGKKTRGARTAAFAEYSNFLKTTGILSADPTEEPAALFWIERGDQRIAVISAVTAYFSDKEVSDQHRTPAPVHAIRALLQQVDRQAMVIVVGHHPPSWFIAETAEHLHSLLVERNALYVHGHEHRVQSRCGIRGLTALGFGAAYVGTLDAAPTVNYRNSFAICELTDSLHVAIYSWDSEYGQWRPEHHVPGDFQERSDRLKDGYQLSMPTTRVSRRPRPYASIAAAVRAEFQIDTCLWLAEDSPKRWTEILRTIGVLRGSTQTYALPSQSLPAGHCQFRVIDEQGQYLVRAIAGHGDILNYEQLQTINTELDRQDYDGCIVATLGECSPEARTLATQLASRKNISVLERADLVRESLRHLPLALERVLIESIDKSSCTGCLVFTQAGVSLLVQERTKNAWFQVLGEDGQVMPESARFVGSIRDELPSLSRLRYEPRLVAQADAGSDQRTSPCFDRAAYLQKCFAHFDDVKYAPLAAVGFRFRKASLSEIYVDASADVTSGGAKQANSLQRAVSEFLESLNLPLPQREQLAEQMRSQYGLNRTVEVGAARKLYQRYNSVLVVGDPGSGKTCFVQHEILAYCSPPEEYPGWYANHLPVYVPLAEAARLVDESVELLDACSTLSARRGIDLPRHVLDEALSAGTGAFFFDGLDEVGLLDKRIALMSQIDGLVQRFAQHGNRFVLTSRPAALQPIEMPEALTCLQLKGLTEGEIRILAQRVLSTRLTDNEGGSLSDDEIELVERLLEDTAHKPGIARIARNPLLLTLLVLIYANTGALSARRHLIYTQAIKTLVSVRGRQTREQQISEADLRTRLGALALSIFRREIAEIPRRTEVRAVLIPTLPAFDDKGSVSMGPDLADAFIQEVAEATGLLAIHANNSVKAEDFITFMHYSFLEYYAAAGLLGRPYLDEVPSIAANPRWKDVTTLLFGMLAEQSDVTPLLERLLGDSTDAESIAHFKTLLALECASECDVPPEASQDVLASAVFSCVSKGAGRFSAELRRELAARLEVFFQAQYPRMERAVIRGLTDKDPGVAAAFADLIARMGNDVVVSDSVIRAFDDYLIVDNVVARTAGLYGIERRSELRAGRAEETVRLSLKGSLVEKHAALKVIAAVPAYAKPLREELRSLLDDSNSLIATGAAQCLLVDLVREGVTTGATPSIEKVLVTLRRETEEDQAFALRGVTLDRGRIESLLNSVDADEKELAIRHMSWLVGEGPFVHKALMQELRQSGLPRHRAACLEALQASREAIDLITIADTDHICKQVEDSNRNVRIAAIKLLGDMPDDEQVVSTLQNHLDEGNARGAQASEITEAAKALAKHVQKNTKLRSTALQAVLERLPKRVEDGFGSAEKQAHLVALMVVCASIGGVADDSAAWQLHGLAVDFRTPMPIRRQALRVFGRIVEPSVRSIEAMKELLQRDDVRLNESVYAAVSSYIGQCRRKVEYVRRVYRYLGDIRQGLCDAWRRERTRPIESINPSEFADIREGVVELSYLMIAYEEFAERASVARPDR